MCWLNHTDRDGLGWLHRGDVSVVGHHGLARLTALNVLQAPLQQRLLPFVKDARLLLTSGEVNTDDWQGLLHSFVAGYYLDGMERTLSTCQRALAHVTQVKALQALQTLQLCELIILVVTL